MEKQMVIDVVFGIESGQRKPGERRGKVVIPDAFPEHMTPHYVVIAIIVATTY